MNNKMVKIQIYQQLDLKKQTKKTKNRDRIMDMESILMVVRWESVMGEWVKKSGD